MATPSEARRATLLLLVMPLFFSSNLVIARAMGDAVPPFTLALLRWGVAVLILLPFTIDGLRQSAALLAVHWRRIALLGFLGMWICGAGVYWALGLTTATNGTLIYTTSPILVLLIERLAYGKALPWIRLAGVLVAMTGVAVIVLKGDPSALARLDLNLGDLGIAAAALAWAVYSLVLRNDGLARLPTMPLFTAIAIAGVATLAPFSAAELAMDGGSPRTAWDWAGVLGLALFSAVGAFSLYQYGVKIVGPQVTSCFLYLLPVYGVGMSVLFLGEALHPHHLLGMALVLGGLVAATVPQDLVTVARGALKRKFAVPGSGSPPSSTP